MTDNINKNGDTEFDIPDVEFDFEDISSDFDETLLARREDLDFGLSQYELSELDLEEAVSLCEQQSKEIRKLRYHYSIALEQLDIARRQCQDYKTMYTSVSSSTMWKLTKPFRLLLDLIKWPFKAHLLRKTVKFFRHVSKYGWNSAFAKVKQKRSEYSHTKSISHTITHEVRTKEEKTKFNKNIKISILVPLYNTPLNFLEEMIDSVVKQTYANWELCLADGSDSEHAEVGRTALRIAKHDERIVYKKLEKNGGISENTNVCLDMATGDYIALFDHDDILHPSALYEVMRAICDKDADYVYTDEATFESPDITKILSLHYKPDFAIDNLRANNYICHLSVFSREVLSKSGKFRKQYDGSQDHDFILRLTSNAKNIVHIPKILYFWRSHPASVAMDINSKKYAIDAGKSAVRDSIKDMGMLATVDSTKVFPAMYRISYSVDSSKKISIVIANVVYEKQFTRCVDSIRSRTTYENYEIITVYNSGAKKAESKIREYESLGYVKAVFSESETVPKLLNEGAKLAEGEYIVFLDGASEIITNNWLEELLMYSQREDVALTAGALYYPDNTIRHAGYIVGHGKNGVAGRMFYRIHNTAVGYMGRLWYSQNLSAVSTEMMMVKKELFFELGGFDTSYNAYYYDLDLCFKAREKGKLIVWTPYASAYTLYTNKIKYRNDAEAAKADYKRIDKIWDEVIGEPDPYYNPNFSIEHSDFSL